MLITFFGTTIMFHADFTIKNYITVPVMIETKIFFDWAFISFNNFLNIKKILNG
jgi:hypothetical protein